jgi:hypothetical protein
MSVSVADIRIYPLNDIPETDISDNVISGAITQAELYIDSVKRDDATTSQINAAVRAMAGYLSFLAYMDRPVQNVAGVMADGYFTPATGTEGIPQVRAVSDMRAKENALKEIMDTFVDIVSMSDSGTLTNIPIPYISIT